MRWIRLLVLIAVICLIETTFLPRLNVAGMHPDLALIFILFVSLHTSPLNAVPAGWLLGLMKDVYSLGPLGLNALILSLCAAYVSRAKDSVYKDHPIAQLFLATTAAILANAIYLAILFLSPETSLGSPQRVAFRMGCAIVLTALPTPFLVVLLRPLRSWLGIKDKITLEPKEEG